MTDQIRFNDGAAYERYMGVWSQRVGDAFLDWCALAKGLRWLDVGCGNGAFTENIIKRCSPTVVHGIDPSAEQIAFASARFPAPVAQFRQGDTMAQPFADDSFDVAVMPLVIFFVPVPATGVAEMVRVVSPGGIIAAYAWDMPGGGFPYEALLVEMQTMGIAIMMLPSLDASRIDVMRDLWIGAGLVDVETREIVVQRVFTDFDDYWATILKGPNVGPRLAALSVVDKAVLASRMRSRFIADDTGAIVCSARANAVKGRVPLSKLAR